jgi:predicted amidohydrolase YtcJ
VSETGEAHTTLLIGGRVHSPSAPDATAMAVSDGAVVWLGQDGPGRALHPDALVVDLDGAFVTPAFVDAHVHATATGLTLSGLDLHSVGDAGELLAVLREGARDTVRPGQTLFAHGWDESTWSNRRLPSRAEIDAAVGDVPVYLSRIDVHSALVSSALVELAPQARAAEGWSDDGPVSMRAHHALRAAFLATITAEQRARAQRAFLDEAAAHGIGTVHEEHYRLAFVGVPCYPIFRRFNELFTDWGESTAREKTGQKREKMASDRAMKVNSSGPKSLLFQGALAESPLPERQFLPSVVGGARGTEIQHAPCTGKTGGWLQM